MTHRIGLTLPCSRLIADITNAVAGPLPLFVQCPAHLETLELQALSAKPSPRPPEEV